MPRALGALEGHWDVGVLGILGALAAGKGTGSTGGTGVLGGLKALGALGESRGYWEHWGVGGRGVLFGEHWEHWWGTGSTGCARPQRRMRKLLPDSKMATLSCPCQQGGGEGWGRSVVRSLPLGVGTRALRCRPIAERESSTGDGHLGGAGAGLEAAPTFAGSGGGDGDEMAEERGLAMVTCTAPVNIAVIKYCEYGRLEAVPAAGTPPRSWEGGNQAGRRQLTAPLGCGAGRWRGRGRGRGRVWHLPGARSEQKCRDGPCHTVPCRATPCHAVSCRDMPRHGAVCQANP